MNKINILKTMYTMYQMFNIKPQHITQFSPSKPKNHQRSQSNYKRKTTVCIKNPTNQHSTTNFRRTPVFFSKTPTRTNKSPNRHQQNTRCSLLKLRIHQRSSSNNIPLTKTQQAIKINDKYQCSSSIPQQEPSNLYQTPTDTSVPYQNPDKNLKISNKHQDVNPTLTQEVKLLKHKNTISVKSLLNIKWNQTLNTINKYQKYQFNTNV